MSRIINLLAAVATISHFALFIILALNLPTASADDGATCYTIVSSDHRAFCLAKARKEPSMCYAIIEPSMRSACLAEVRN